MADGAPGRTNLESLVEGFKSKLTSMKVAKDDSTNLDDVPKRANEVTIL